MSDKQKEIDKKKRQEKKKSLQSVLEKKASHTKKRSWKTEEEIDVQRSKEEYDRSELIRKKFIENLVKKDEPISFDELIKKLRILQKNMGDIEDMKLFIALTQLFKDNSKYITYRNRILKNLLKKGYDTNVIIELLSIIKIDEDLTRRYNKLKYVNDETDEEFKIVDKYGDIDTLIENEKEFLVSILKKFVLKREAFRLESILKAAQEIKDRKRSFTPEEIKQIEDQERLRKDFIDFIDDIDDIDLFIEEGKDENTDLFLNVSRFLSEVLDVDEFKNFFRILNEEYSKNFNTIISILSVIENKDYDDVIRVRDENNIQYILEEDNDPISVLHKLYNKIRFNVGKDGYLTSLLDLYGNLDELLKQKKTEFAILAFEEDMPNIFDRKGKGKDKTKWLETVREELEYIKKLRQAQEIQRMEELEEFAQKEEIELETLIKDARIQIVEENGKKEILQFVRLLPMDFSIKKRGEKVDFDFIESEKYKQYIKSPDLEYSPDTLISSYKIDKKNKLRQEGKNILEKFFDKDGANVLEDQILKESKTVGDYMNRIGDIVIFVDDNYLKKLARSFNSRLENMYYDTNVILTLTIKEILQEIYNNPSYENDKINELIEKNKKLFNYNILKRLNRGPLDKLRDDRTFYKNRDIKNIYSANLGMCTPKWTDDDTLPRDIIYYHDKQDDNVYCFNLFEIYDQILADNIVNPHTKREFSKEFIDMIKHYSSPDKIKENIKIKEESEKKQEKDKKEKEEKVQEKSKEIVELYKNLNDLEMSLKEKVSKDQACAYYSKYVFTNSRLEKDLEKTAEMKRELKDFCGEEMKENILDAFNLDESEISIPYPSPSKSASPKSSLVLEEQSLPSFLLPAQEDAIKEDAIKEESIQEQPIQVESIQEQPIQEQPIQEQPIQEDSIKEAKKKKIQELAKKLKKI